MKEIETGEDMPIPVEYIFLEVPNCRKAMTSEASLLDNFCYAMRKMPEMEERPKELKGEIFDLLFSSAEITKFAPKERSEYIKQMITIRDIVNQMATAEEKGLAKGLAEGRAKGLAEGRAEGDAQARQETAAALLKMGMDAKTVSEATRLSIEEILSLQNK